MRTDEELAVEFFKKELFRAEKNLENAQKRQDERAIANIEKKILCYKLAISVLNQVKAPNSKTI